MRKVLITLMMVFGLSVAAFAEVKLLPKDVFNNYVVSAFEGNTLSIQPQIAYVADTWEEVYEKTGVDKYGWEDVGSGYEDCTDQLFVIVKVTVDGEIGWMCIEWPGDSSVTFYVTFHVDKRFWY